MHCYNCGVELAEDARFCKACGSEQKRDESDTGKRHVMKAKNDDTMYNYYKIGDRVRHHAELNSFEKYDKTGDEFIPCNACATLCDINDDYCFRCKCPLLK